ncbi:MAG: hypothetical protein IT173_12115 [Acidobacteria bacterium]|nr:hypothetical protein [Acidobacteriota bacterium]
MSSEKLTVVKDLDFAARFAVACGTNKPAEIRRKYGISYHAARNYLEGRVPAADKLKEIRNLTNVNLNWLLLGEGEIFERERERGPEPPGLLDALDERIRAVVREELERTEGRTGLGIDEFLAGSIRRHDDPAAVMAEWYRHEGWPMRAISVPIFADWDGLTIEEKVNQIRAHHDENVRHVKRHEILSPETTKPAS